jgi:hypothetical protein
LAPVAGGASPAADAPPGVVRGGYQPTRPTTAITVVDQADPAHPKVVRTHRLDGSYVDARLVGGVARVVYRSLPQVALPQPSPNGQGDATAAKQAVAAAPAQQLLPKGTACGDAYVAKDEPNVQPTAASLSVVSIDPSATSPGAPVTVVGDAGVVYASGSRLVVAATRWVRSPAPAPQPTTVPSTVVTPGSSPMPTKPFAAPMPAAVEQPRTVLHAFDLSNPAKATYLGSGDVPGQLEDRLGISEHGGAIRVATDLQAWNGPGSSRIGVLQQGRGGELVEVGHLDGLGDGEHLYGVRYAGDLAYLVTFRQLDPLHVVDLHDPKAPKLLGQLEVTGYSAYLHPLSDRRLLGLGQEATPQGRRVGTQLSLFDVGDPTKPTKLAGVVIKGASSAAEQDLHSFTFAPTDPATPAQGLVAVPLISYQPTTGQAAVGVEVFRVGDRTVADVGQVTHPGHTQIERTIVLGDRLLSVSPVGVAANATGDLADRGFTAFR